MAKRNEQTVVFLIAYTLPFQNDFKFTAKSNMNAPIIKAPTNNISEKRHLATANYCTVLNPLAVARMEYSTYDRLHCNHPVVRIKHKLLYLYIIPIIGFGISNHTIMNCKQSQAHLHF